MFHAWCHIRCKEMGMELASLLGFKNTPAWSWSHSLSSEDVSMDCPASFKMARELSEGRVFLFIAAISFPFFTDESVSLSPCRSSGTVLHPQRRSEKGKIKKQKYRLKPPSLILKGKIKEEVCKDSNIHSHLVHSREDGTSRVLPRQLERVIDK